MNAREAAKELDVSISTVTTYIKEGLLIPDNLDTWKIEGEYLIPQEQIEELKRKLYPGGLTTKEAADYVGGHCQPFHILQAINKGTLNTRTSNVLNRVQYFVQKDERLEDFKVNFAQKANQNKRHFDSSRRIFLYQSYRHKETNEVVRVMDIDKEDGYAENQLGEKIKLHKLPVYYEPLTSYELGKPSNRTGHVVFKFAKPTHIKSLTFTLIEMIAEQTGVKHFSLKVENSQIIIKVKPFMLSFPEGSVDQDLVDHAKRSLVSGELRKRKDDFVFFSTDKKVNLVLNSEQYRQLNDKAVAWNMTVEEYIMTNLELLI